MMQMCVAPVSTSALESLVVLKSVLLNENLNLGHDLSAQHKTRIGSPTKRFFGVHDTCTSEPLTFVAGKLVLLQGTHSWCRPREEAIRVGERG
jgi:hypothetical protein